MSSSIRPRICELPSRRFVNVKTPTMLMTGELDLRTPISQTEEFYEALKIRRVPTAMVRFNEEFHGTTSKPSNFMRTQLYLRYEFKSTRRNSAQDTQAGRARITRPVPARPGSAPVSG
ncbi:MAG: prolyl oligopeptidase family serine peptidase [Candidatus Acidiferrales bacterium]